MPALEMIERNSVVVLVIATCAALLLNRLPGALGGDAWLLLLAGREVVESGLPARDRLTVWSQGEPWVDQQWAAQLVFYGVHALGGVKGLLLGNAALILAAFAGGLACARGIGAGVRSVAVVGVVAAPLLVADGAVRARSLAYPLFVALLALLMLAARRGVSRRVLLTLPILVVWANVDSSVLIGAALVTLFAAFEAVNRLRRRTLDGWAFVGLLAGAPWACALASPYALDLPGYYQWALGHVASAELVGGWGPSAIPAQLPFFAFAGVATWIVARNRALTAFERAAFAFTVAAGIVEARNVVWFVLLSVLVLPTAVDTVWPERVVRQRRRRVSILLACTALGIVGFGLFTGVTRPSTDYLGPYSRSAEEALRSAVVGNDKRVFANERYADWLLWLSPDLRGRVAFDSRLELLGTDELKKIARWRERSGDGWRAAASGFDLLVLDLESERDVVLSLIGDDLASATYTNGRLILLVSWASVGP